MAIRSAVDRHGEQLNIVRANMALHSEQLVAAGANFELPALRHGSAITARRLELPRPRRPARGPTAGPTRRTRTM